VLITEPFIEAARKILITLVSFEIMDFNKRKISSIEFDYIIGINIASFYYHLDSALVNIEVVKARSKNDILELIFITICFFNF
jgi:hypothetical protein